MWSPPPAEPAQDWYEIKTLLTTPTRDAGSARRGVRSVLIVAAALVLGGGVLAASLMRTDCGASCHAVTADAPRSEAPRAVATAAPASQSDLGMVEGRSVADPAAGADGASSDAGAADPMAPPVPRRHHHHHHHLNQP